MPLSIEWQPTVERHAEGKKYKDAIAEGFFGKNSQHQEEMILKQVETPTQHEILSENIINQNITSVEVVWILKVVVSWNYSYSSSDAMADVSKCMFPSSNIANKIIIGRTKLIYVLK